MHTLKRIFLPVIAIILLAILNIPVFAQQSGMIERLTILGSTELNMGSASYDWRVRAKNGSDVSLPLSMPPTARPVLVAPQVNASISTPNITFSWNSVVNATNYQIQISTSSVFVSIFHDNQSASTTYNYTFTAAGAYYWRVRGTNANGDGPWSLTRGFYVNIPPQSAPTLTAPIHASTTTNADVVFSWESVGGASQYEIHISRVSNFDGFTVLNHTLSATTYTYKMYTTGTYYWRVRAKNNAGYSLWSSGRQFILQPMNPPALQAPTNASTVSNPNVAFSWGAVDYAPQYQIQIGHAYIFSYSGEDLLHDAIVTSPAHNYAFSGVGTYYWRVRARNGNVQGTWSEVYQVTVQSDSAPALLSPHNLAISYSPTFVLTWTAVSGATNYELQFARDYNFTAIIEQRTTTNTTSTYTFSLYDRYYWRVRAIGELWSQPRAITFAFIPFSSGTTTFVNANFAYFPLDFRNNGQSLFINRDVEYDFLTQTTNDLLIEEGVAGLGSITGFFIQDISADGRYALVQMTFEGVYGAYLYDRVMGTVTLVSKYSDGTPMTSTFGMDISDDNNLIVLMTEQSDYSGSIVLREYFLHNYQTGQTTQVATTSPTLMPYRATLSPNNRYMALVYVGIPYPTTGGVISYLYLYDVETQVSTPVMTPNNTPVTIVSFGDISPAEIKYVFYGDDRYLVFNSLDPLIAPNTPNTNIFIYDIQTGLFESVLVTPNGENNRLTFVQDVTPDGRYVVFKAYIYTAMGGVQLYVYDRQRGTTTHISVNSSGIEGMLSNVVNGRISSDGNHVAFNGTIEHYGILRQGTHIYTLPSDISSVAFGQGAFSPARLSAVGSGSLTTEFRWTPIRGILDYQIQIATDNEFNTILYDVDVNTTSHTQTFPQTGTYYWRVRGENSWGDGLWSDTFHIIIGEGATVVIDEQLLFTMAQPLLTHDITSVLFDITPTGIFTTTQFGNGAVVTAIIRLPLINGLIRVNTESVVGGNVTQQSAIYEVMPALLLTILDERLPDNYLVVESIGLTGSTITMNIVLPSNP